MQKLLGQKILVIGLIGLLLWVPLLWISGQVDERQNFQQTARDEVASSWTGAQILMSPVLVIEYQHKTRRAVSQMDNGTTSYREVTEAKRLLIPATSAETASSLATEMRQKGIYSVPVYRAEVSMEGHFSATEIQQQLVEIRNHKDFSHVDSIYLALHLADPRGIEGAPEIHWRNAPVAFVPGSGIPQLSEGVRALLSHDTTALAQSSAPLNFLVRFRLRGMESLQILPAARQFTLQLDSSWPHPAFSGAFLPTARNITNAGFSAQWAVNEFATGIGEKLRTCANNDCVRLLDSRFGVNLFQSVDIYQQTERAIKYALLFITLTFASFFIFETLQRLPIHPIQYSFVGLALVVFYLLLLSLSEHLPFAQAYFAGAAACCALNGFYLHYVMRGWLPACLFTGALLTLYGILYVILSMEDYAQLTGAVLVFVMLAAAMLLTRKIDWYQLQVSARTSVSR